MAVPLHLRLCYEEQDWGRVRAPETCLLCPGEQHFGDLYAYPLAAVEGCRLLNCGHLGIDGSHVLVEVEHEHHGFHDGGRQNEWVSRVG